MDIDEAYAKLRELGIPVGGWSDVKAEGVTPPILKKQKELLVQLEPLIEEQIKKDQQQVADLHATLQRIKHGGGGVSRG